MDHAPLTATEIERKALAQERQQALRRGMVRTVKDAREKITSASGLRRVFEVELARLFAQNRIHAVLAIVPFTLIMGATTLLWSTPMLSGLWSFAALFVLTAQYAIARRFLSRDIEMDGGELARWIRRLIASEIALVFCWALMPIVVGAPTGEGLRLYLLFAILVMGAVSAVLSHPLPGAVYGAILPLAATVVLLTLDRSPTERWMIAALSLTALALFAGLANRLYASTMEIINARAQKDDLYFEVERANLQLKEATKRAEDANAAKSKFLATMSHELRTPLNAILGFSEVIKSEMFGPVGNEQYKSYIEDIHKSGEHLLGLINEVLDLSRIEAGKHELQEEAIDLAAAIEECCHMLELRAASKGSKLRNTLTRGMPRLWADERAVRQVALNLLSNAIKFSPQGAEIVVKVGWTRNHGQYLSVKDNGPGIPEDEIDTVLSTFGRGSRAIKDAEQGSGLGLPIVKSLVELHGGTFHLVSRPGHGTEVIAMFPANRVMAAMAAVTEPTLSLRPGTRAA